MAALPLTRKRNESDRTRNRDKTWLIFFFCDIQGSIVCSEVSYQLQETGSSFGLQSSRQTRGFEGIAVNESSLVIYGLGKHACRGVHL